MPNDAGKWYFTISIEIIYSLVGLKTKILMILHLCVFNNTTDHVIKPQITYYGLKTRTNPSSIARDIFSYRLDRLQFKGRKDSRP